MALEYQRWSYFPTRAYGVNHMRLSSPAPQRVLSAATDPIRHPPGSTSNQGHAWVTPRNKSAPPFGQSEEIRMIQVMNEPTPSNKTGPVKLTFRSESHSGEVGEFHFLYATPQRQSSNVDTSLGRQSSNVDTALGRQSSNVDTTPGRQSCNVDNTLMGQSSNMNATPGRQSSPLKSSQREFCDMKSSSRQECQQYHREESLDESESPETNLQKASPQTLIDKLVERLCKPTEASTRRSHLPRLKSAKKSGEYRWVEFPVFRDNQKCLYTPQGSVKHMKQR